MTLLRTLALSLLLTPAVTDADPSSTTPVIVAPDVISGPGHDSAPAFAPDGQTVYFTRSNSSVSTIVVAQRRGDGWSSPTVAPFSGQWSDMEPTMAPDGSFLVFVSNRPQQGTRPLDGSFNNKAIAGGGGNLCRVARTAAGWATPVRMPATINRSSNVFAPSITRDGSLYFMEPVKDTGKFHLFRSQLDKGVYQPATPVAFSNDPEVGDVDPAVAPDESYLVFSSSRAPSIGGMDLFLVARTPDGKWGAPRHLGDKVNSAGSDAESRLSPDGRTLYFASDRTVPVQLLRKPDEAARDLRRMSWDNGLYNIWQVDLAPWLAAR